MKLNYIIRNEVADDIDAINQLTITAFKTLDVSIHTEQFIIKNLRQDGALTISLVAELNKKIIGHITFSPVKISDGQKGWFALGPVSVMPEFQKQGIGKALINQGLSILKNNNAQGCCLVGHPQYYQQFGFKNIPDLIIVGVPPEFIFGLSFTNQTPKGLIIFHKAFMANS